MSILYLDLNESNYQKILLPFINSSLAISKFQNVAVPLRYLT